MPIDVATPIAPQEALEDVFTISSDERKVTLREVLTTYERDMLRYGFALVREAGLIGQQRVAKNPLPPA